MTAVESALSEMVLALQAELAGLKRELNAERDRRHELERAFTRPSPRVLVARANRPSRAQLAKYMDRLPEGSATR